MTTKHSRPFVKYAALLKSGKMTEVEINSLKRLLGRWSNTSAAPEELKELEDLMYDVIEAKEGIRITAEQTEKGIKWLRDQWKTPRGVERKHNPFGYREEDVLEHFTHFTFEGFYDNGRYQYRDLCTIWGVHSADGYFEYYMGRGTGYNGGTVEIIG